MCTDILPFVYYRISSNILFKIIFSLLNVTLKSIHENKLCHVVAYWMILASNWQDFFSIYKVQKQRDWSQLLGQIITSQVVSVQEWSYWRMDLDPGSEELGSTNGNLISDNRSCRRHKPTWASEGTRTRRASLHVQHASCGKRINPRKGRARMENVRADLSADSSASSLLPIKAGN